MLEPAYRAALEGRESAFELPHGDRDHLHRVVPVRNRAGSVVAGMLVAQDITDRKTREHRLRQWASRDGLTGLWNRERLLEEIDRFLHERRRRDDGAGSLLFVDLDGFKAVNDSYGHAAGDELLRAVAQAIEGRVRYSDTVARIGGDEFAVLLPGATPAQAARVAEKVTAAVAEVWPPGLGGGASVGVAAVEPDDSSAAEVLAAADRRDVLGQALTAYPSRFVRPLRSATIPRTTASTQTCCVLHKGSSKELRLQPRERRGAARVGASSSGSTCPGRTTPTSRSSATPSASTRSPSRTRRTSTSARSWTSTTTSSSSSSTAPSRTTTGWSRSTASTPSAASSRCTATTPPPSTRCASATRSARGRSSDPRCSSTS